MGVGVLTLTNNEHIKVFALGGLGEIGKNTYVVEYREEIIIIDAGIKFPGDELFGIDYIIPDYSYLVKNQHKIKGIVVTHGHEDHIGGIPYLLKTMNIPIYAGKFGLAIIKEKLEEHGLLRDAKLQEIQEDTVLSFHDLSVEFFTTTHSTPDSFGIVVNSPYGKIVHTGDFKFDLTPIGRPPNLNKIAEIGKSGVLCLLSDSTNSEIPGFSMSESRIQQTIIDLFQQIKGRIIFATFASNLYRVKQAIEAALKYNRKIVILGRSLERAVRIGQELDYLNIPPNSLIHSSEINKYLDEEIAVICTGSQGEPFAALSRMANKRHPKLAIRQGDTIIFSSSPIPGNVLSINKIKNQLSEAGAEIIHHKLKSIHTSGHGAQEELKLMLRLTNPKFFIPIHGEYRMLKKHVALAKDVGIPTENSFILDNGHILEVNEDHARIGKTVPANPVYVDGEGIGDIGNIVLRDRRILSESGILLVIISLDLKKGEILSGPEIITRGFVFMRESAELLDSIRDNVKSSVLQSLDEGHTQWNDIKKDILKKVEPFIYEETKRRPMILPIIMEIK